MSSYGEYLRRKLATLPKTYGPSKYGDESLRTSVTRYDNSKPPLPTLTTSTTPACCKSLHWRSTNFSVPSGGPYNGRNGDGQQQEWSMDGLISSRACCAQTSEYITVGCCPPDRPSGIYYDASGNPLTLAYQGAKSPCCGFQSTRKTVATLLPDCSCAIDPSVREDTLAANNMPIAEIPFVPATKGCCHFNYIECTCCDANGDTQYSDANGYTY